MKRWLIAAVFIACPALLLRHLPERQKILRDEAPQDEILAYELLPSQSVKVTVPGGLDALVITTWVILPLGADPSSAARVAYALDADLFDPAGQRKESRTYHLESRVSGPADTDRTTARGARLADSDEIVTDSRTIALDRSEALPGGGFLRITNPGANARVLLTRLSLRDPRGTLARKLNEASLTIEAKQHIVADRVSLGFVDLHESARQAGLGAFGTRLSAVGREGYDYVLLRLLLEDYRGPIAVPPRRDLGFDVSEAHSAALNFGAPLTVRLDVPPHQKLRLKEGDSSERWISTGEGGPVDVALSGDGPRTVVLSSDHPTEVHVRCFVDREGARAQLGDVRAAWAEEGRYEIGEDLRTSRYARLDASAPVVARVAPGQTALRVMVRGEVTRADATVALAMVEAKFQPPGGPEQTTSFHVTLPRSKFERWRSLAVSAPLANDATDSYSETLALPQGIREVRLYGDPHLLVKLFVPEPDVASDELRLPYRVTLREQESWRNAPYDIRTWAPILPENQTSLEETDRALDLVAQVRIERQSIGLAPRPERLLPPEGDPVRRTLLVAAKGTAPEPMPLDAWSPIEGTSEIQVDGKGPRAGKIEVTYQAAADRLGKPIRLVVDGTEAAHAKLSLASGAIRADVAPGKHRVEVDGLGEGTAYVDAAPTGGGAIVRRRAVYELTHERPLEFRFEQKTSEILHAVVFVAAENRDRPFRLGYTIDDGRVVRHTGRFYRVTTVPRGELAGRTGDLGRGLLWEAPSNGAKEAFPHGISWAKIHVGDDLPAGVRRLKLFLDPLSDSLWVRVVLVGQDEALPEADTRAWASEAM